jgi:hypothetical protein
MIKYHASAEAEMLPADGRPGSARAAPVRLHLIAH